MPGSLLGAAQALDLGVSQSYSMMQANPQAQVRNFGQQEQFQQKLKKKDPNDFQNNYDPNQAYSLAASKMLLGTGPMSI